MSTYAEKRKIFYSNMLLLGFDPKQSQLTARIAFTIDMFKVPNKAGFEAVTHFLFNRLNPARAKDEFRDCWPIHDKKSEQAFRRICTGWLAQIAQDESDSHLPKIVPSIFQSPGGDKFCHLMFAFSNYVVLKVIKNEHGVKLKDILLRPILTPQELDFSAAMVQSVQCNAIGQRSVFFDKSQDRESLHKSWQKFANDLLCEYRRLSKAIRQREADIKSLVEKSKEKGIFSPARMNVFKKPGTPNSKCGKLFDVSVENEKRKEKIQKVRDMWHTVDGFFASNDDYQKIVSSVITGVIHKNVLDSSNLDLRIPEMLLRECEKELLKRDISNTYKAGKLDLISLVNLWNLALHLYLEKLEECKPIDLTDQLKDLQKKATSHSSDLNETKQLRNTLSDELIPDLKESIVNWRSKYHSQKNDVSLVQSKTGLSFQPKTPEMSFENDGVTEADMEATKVTCTPDMFPKETTPAAVSRILECVQKAVEAQTPSTPENKTQKPQNDKQTLTPQRKNVKEKQEGPMSPLAQGIVYSSKRGHGLNYFGSTCYKSSKPKLEENASIHSQEQQETTNIFSPQGEGQGCSDEPSFSKNVDEKFVNMTNKSISKNKSIAEKFDNTPTTTKQQKENKNPYRSSKNKSLTKENSSLVASGLSELSSYSQKSLDSPTDILASRIAETADGDQDSMLSDSEENYKANILDEISESGFVSRDKLARTPDTSKNNSRAGREIFVTPDKWIKKAEEEELITTVYSNTRSLSPSDSLDSSHLSSDKQRSSPHKVKVQGNRRLSRGRAIVDSILDEQPLFLDSPSLDEENLSINDDFMELSLNTDAPDTRRQLSDTSQRLPTQTSLGDLIQKEQMTMDELLRRYRKLKEQSAITNLVDFD